MDWKLVHVAQGDVEASVIRSVLASQKITAQEVQESIGRMHAINVDGLGQIEFYVPEDRWEDAHQILRRVQD